MKYSPKQFHDLLLNQRRLIKTENGRTLTTWVTARPYCAAGLLTRLKHAFLVLVGHYDVIDWGEE